MILRPLHYLKKKKNRLTKKSTVQIVGNLEE